MFLLNKDFSQYYKISKMELDVNESFDIPPVESGNNTERETMDLHKACRLGDLA
jgi:hypothetical protein